MKPTETRTVVHMDLDAFFVSVERMRDSRLEGKPLIIGGTGGRGVVSSCSYEARKFGVRSAMPMKMARRLCPEATVIRGDMELYTRYSRTVTDIVRERSPLFEKASIDEFYIDMTGMDRFFGAWKWAGELRGLVAKETGLPMSFGLSVNKTVAKVATNEAKPAGCLQIQRGGEADFLGPLPVGRIPSAGAKTVRTLAELGVRHIAVLREVPREYLHRILGRHGNRLWERAWGIDPSPVTPWHEAKSVSTERTFGEDTMDIRGLQATLAGMAEKLAWELRKKGRLSACLTLKLRYADFNTVTRQERLPYTADDTDLARRALALFEKLYDRRQRLRLVGLRCSELIYGGRQTDLFADSEADLRLAQAIDKLKAKYGPRVISRGIAWGSLTR